MGFSCYHHAGTSLKLKFDSVECFVTETLIDELYKVVDLIRSDVVLQQIVFNHLFKDGILFNLVFSRI